MHIKTYRAQDLASALTQARSELGPDALVLATNEVRGRLGLTSVELTVAVDKIAQLPIVERIERRHERRRRGRPDVDERGGPPTERKSSEPDPARRRRPLDGKRIELPAEIRSAAEQLMASGLTRDLAMRFARSATRAARNESSDDARARALGELVPFARVSPRTRVLFVVGPPGAGKTTTVAKLAARFAVERDRPVVIAQADADRIGSLEQARIYSRCLGVELVRVDAPDELARAVERAGSRGTVIVDTAGIGGSDGARLSALLRLREAVSDAEVTLLLPAGLHRDAVGRALDRFAPIGPTCAALSRIDDGGPLGELVSALAERRLPLAFLTTGHRVPHDLEDASPGRLLSCLVGDPDTRHRQETDR